MSEISKYLAEIGRKGGQKSRRKLTKINEEISCIVSGL